MQPRVPLGARKQGRIGVPWISWRHRFNVVLLLLRTVRGSCRTDEKDRLRSNGLLTTGCVPCERQAPGQRMTARHSIAAIRSPMLRGTASGRQQPAASVGNRPGAGVRHCRMDRRRSPLIQKIRTMIFRSFFRSSSSKQATEQLNDPVHRTVNCKRFDHPEFQIQVSDRTIPAVDIGWLLRFLEQSVAGGERFRAGETLQIGWMLTMLEVGKDDILRIMEPDMKAIPIEFIDSVDSTLKHLRNQKDIVASVALTQEPDFPSLRQSAVVHVDYKSASSVLLTRYPARETDSGWTLTDLNDEAGSQDPSRYVKISLYQLGVNRPDLVQFLALPSGMQVVVAGSTIRVKDSDGEIQPVPGSYLEALNGVQLQRVDK
ncbi:hypothetical protein BUUB107078_32005 [Burkholderia ubonensis]|nr:hypothetical protein BUB20358_04422 [Burkholderia ubonensis]